MFRCAVRPKMRLFTYLLWWNKQTCDGFKMKGKAKACNSRTVATFGWLELRCWRPNGRGSCGFQDYAFGIGLGSRVVSRARSSARSALMQTVKPVPALNVIGKRQ
jgi:hypothetical protein